MSSSGQDSEHTKDKRADSRSDPDLPSLDASGIAEYIRFDCCPRYFKLKLEKGNGENRSWPGAFKPLSPLLYGAGKEMEKNKTAELRKKAAQYYDLTCIDTRVSGWEDAWARSSKIIRDIVERQLSTSAPVDYKPVLVYQAPMAGHVGVWDVKGRADLIGIWPLEMA